MFIRGPVGGSVGAGLPNDSECLQQQGWASALRSLKPAEGIRATSKLNRIFTAILVGSLDFNFGGNGWDFPLPVASWCLKKQCGRVPL